MFLYPFTAGTFNFWHCLKLLITQLYFTNMKIKFSIKILMTSKFQNCPLFSYLLDNLLWYVQGCNFCGRFSITFCFLVLLQVDFSQEETGSPNSVTDKDMKVSPKMHRNCEAKGLLSKNDWKMKTFLNFKHHMLQFGLIQQPLSIPISIDIKM